MPQDHESGSGEADGHGHRQRLEDRLRWVPVVSDLKSGMVEKVFMSLPDAGHYKFYKISLLFRLFKMNISNSDVSRSNLRD